MSRYAWGIDIGDGTLKAIRLKADGRSLQIVRVVVIPYLDPFLKKKSLPTTLDRRAVAALYQFGSSVPIADPDRVAVGFPSVQAIEGVIEIPRVEDDQKEKMIQFEVAALTDVPLQDLAIHSVHHRYRSEDIEQVLIHATKARELEAFLNYLEESKIPYDRIVSSGAALVDMARLCVRMENAYLIISPGYNATVLTALNGNDFWTRILPLGLPVAPGESIEVARDRIDELCGVLTGEIESFFKWIRFGQAFHPKKVLVSGEGARIPAFINRLDAALSAPVEVMRPVTRLNPVPQKQGMPPESEVLSMGKAIGLAVGAVDETRKRCTLAESLPRRRALKRLPLLTALCSLVLVMVLFLWWMEHVRSRRIDGIEDGLRTMAPSPRADEMEDLAKRVKRFHGAIQILEETHKTRKRLLSAGKLLARIEEASIRGTFGDYFLRDLEMTFEEGGALKATMGTRLSGEEMVKEEIQTLFKAISREPAIEGPLPSGEETPPEGLAPLVLYHVDGDVR